MDNSFNFRQHFLVILFLLGCIWPNRLPAQDESADDNLFTQSNQAWVYELYDSLFETNLDLINGRNHSERYPAGTGHPFFISQQSMPGHIICGGKKYTYPHIRYDVFNDMLQIHHFARTGSYILDLNKQDIDGFKLDGHTFVQIREDEIHDAGITPGFYELKHQGKYTFWIRWEKNYSDRTVETSGGYENSEQRYIQAGDQWYRIVNRRSLLKAIPEYQDEIKAYLRNSGISLRIATVEELLTVIRYCESIE